MELEIVEVSADHVQVVDRHGRIVGSYPSRREAEAFVTGYRLGRDEASRIARNAVADLPARIGTGV